MVVSNRNRLAYFHFTCPLLHVLAFIIVFGLALTTLVAADCSPPCGPLQACDPLGDDNFECGTRYKAYVFTDDQNVVLPDECDGVAAVQFTSIYDITYIAITTDPTSQDCLAAALAGIITEVLETGVDGVDECFGPDEASFELIPNRSGKTKLCPLTTTENCVNSQYCQADNAYKDIGIECSESDMEGKCPDLTPIFANDIYQLETSTTPEQITTACGSAVMTYFSPDETQVAFTGPKFYLEPCLTNISANNLATKASVTCFLQVSGRSWQWVAGTASICPLNWGEQCVEAQFCQPFSLLPDSPVICPGSGGTCRDLSLVTDLAVYEIIKGTSAEFPGVCNPLNENPPEYVISTVTANSALGTYVVFTGAKDYVDDCIAKLSDDRIQIDANAQDCFAVNSARDATPDNPVFTETNESPLCPLNWLQPCSPNQYCVTINNQADWYHGSPDDTQDSVQCPSEGICPSLHYGVSVVYTTQTSTPNDLPSQCDNSSYIFVTNLPAVDQTYVVFSGVELSMDQCIATLFSLNEIDTVPGNRVSSANECFDTTQTPPASNAGVNELCPLSWGSACQSRDFCQPPPGDTSSEQCPGTTCIDYGSCVPLDRVYMVTDWAKFDDVFKEKCTQKMVNSHSFTPLYSTFENEIIYVAISGAQETVDACVSNLSGDWIVADNTASQCFKLVDDQDSCRGFETQDGSGEQCPLDWGSQCTVSPKQWCRDTPGKTSGVECPGDTLLCENRDWSTSPLVIYESETGLPSDPACASNGDLFSIESITRPVTNPGITYFAFAGANDHVEACINAINNSDGAFIQTTNQNMSRCLTRTDGVIVNHVGKLEKCPHDWEESCSAKEYCMNFNLESSQVTTQTCPAGGQCPQVGEITSYYQFGPAVPSFAKCTECNIAGGIQCVQMENSYGHHYVALFGASIQVQPCAVILAQEYPQSKAVVDSIDLKISPCFDVGSSVTTPGATAPGASGRCPLPWGGQCSGAEIFCPTISSTKSSGLCQTAGDPCIDDRPPIFKRIQAGTIALDGIVECKDVKMLQPTELPLVTFPTGKYDDIISCTKQLTAYLDQDQIQPVPYHEVSTCFALSQETGFIQADSTATPGSALCPIRYGKNCQPGQFCQSLPGVAAEVMECPTGETYCPMSTKLTSPIHLASASIPSSEIPTTIICRDPLESFNMKIITNPYGNTFFTVGGTERQVGQCLSSLIAAQSAELYADQASGLPWSVSDVDPCFDSEKGVGTSPACPFGLGMSCKTTGTLTTYCQDEDLTRKDDVPCPSSKLCPDDNDFATEAPIYRLKVSSARPYTKNVPSTDYQTNETITEHHLTTFSECRYTMAGSDVTSYVSFNDMETVYPNGANQQLSLATLYGPRTAISRCADALSAYIDSNLPHSSNPATDYAGCFKAESVEKAEGIVVTVWEPNIGGGGLCPKGHGSACTQGTDYCQAVVPTGGFGDLVTPICSSDVCFHSTQIKAGPPYQLFPYTSFGPDVPVEEVAFTEQDCDYQETDPSTSFARRSSFGERDIVRSRRQLPRLAPASERVRSAPSSFISRDIPLAERVRILTEKGKEIEKTREARLQLRASKRTLIPWDSECQQPISSSSSFPSTRDSAEELLVYSHSTLADTVYLMIVGPSSLVDNCYKHLSSQKFIYAATDHGAVRCFNITQPDGPEGPIVPLGACGGSKTCPRKRGGPCKPQQEWCAGWTSEDSTICPRAIDQNGQNSENSTNTCPTGVGKMAFKFMIGKDSNDLPGECDNVAKAPLATHYGTRYIIFDGLNTDVDPCIASGKNKVFQEFPDANDCFITTSDQLKDPSAEIVVEPHVNLGHSALCPIDYGKPCTSGTYCQAYNDPNMTKCPDPVAPEVTSTCPPFPVDSENLNVVKLTISRPYHYLNWQELYPRFWNETWDMAQNDAMLNHHDKWSACQPDDSDGAADITYPTSANGHTTHSIYVSRGKCDLKWYQSVFDDTKKAFNIERPDWWKYKTTYRYSAFNLKAFSNCYAPVSTEGGDAKLQCRADASNDACALPCPDGYPCDGLSGSVCGSGNCHFLLQQCTSFAFGFSSQFAGPLFIILITLQLFI